MIADIIYYLVVFIFLIPPFLLLIALKKHPSSTKMTIEMYETDTEGNKVINAEYTIR